ncbi:MAG: amidase [Peptococcales bacterium]
MYTKRLLLNELATSLRSGEKDIFSYINETCDLIEKVEPQIKALLPEPNRRERLLKEAKELEEKYPNFALRPPLYGVLIGVKDIFNVDGFPTQAGSRLPKELFEGPEALCVKKLREAGALILGKTVTTEFAYFHPGPTRNPHNLKHTPGGSSSGSAAAVSAGFCPLAFGTQTIGSIIRPAAYCGIVGFKPSYDRIPTEGMIYFSKTSDHVGLFTQDIEGMILAASVFCLDWQEQDIPRELPILGIPEGSYLDQATPEALHVFSEQINLLKAKGYKVKPVNAFEDIADINKRHRELGAAEMAQVHSAWYGKHKDLYSLHSVQVFEKGEKISSAKLSELQIKGKELRGKLAKIMEEEGIDLWVSPSATDTAPLGLESTGNPIMNLPWTHAGVPVISLPVGQDSNKLPWGLQIAARFMQDEKLLVWSQGIYEIFQSRG